MVAQRSSSTGSTSATEPADLPASGLLFPLALRRSDETDETVVRTILGVDDEQQSLTFAGDVPEGSLVQLMRANFDRLVDGAAEAGVAAAGSTAGPVLSIGISCVGATPGAR